ncbi:M1 family aminopeptidase [Caulobacter sp. NIBR1757]|uniref:M1 family aminopeptidase n=1 Tax=Caulobacter sp. NIBR1757 TaxID=3016000 RepID=UPI0022F04A9F|nr:M1 family aminopeptidase [Caulobacter sp. NIBR1757]WGM40235.1 hypothetical protein AMEJIAPC_03176 [Caulobacter sp. NIBR1757]
MTPLRYRLHLAPDPAAGAFTGEVTVEFAIDAAAEAFMLDCLDLAIDGAWVDDAPAAWRLDGDKLVVTPPAPLANPASVRLTYAGRLSETPRGLYRGEGFVASQLQPNHARRVFPCLDDPAHRAVLDLSVAVPEGWTALSNAAVTANAGGVTRFAPSPPLPTHLMALALGAFRTISAGPVSLHTLAPGPSDAWVLQTAVAALAVFGDWLGVPYPFGKLDLVLLPEIGVAGMENTGAIFLRQAALARPTREAATLIAHEIAHQWFGGLVTPAGWEELWLNEGFATWLAPRAVAADLADDAAEVAALRAALIGDSGPGARPLSGPVPDDPSRLFDILTYRKGAALLRMLEGWIGETAMRAGLGRYLQDHALGVARSADLWAALEAASGQPVAAVAGDFVRRIGPARIALRWRDRTVHLAQRGDDLVSLPVNLRIATESGEVRQTLLLEGPTASLTLPGEVRWAVADGYFRTTYPDGPPPLSALTGSEAVVLVEDAWLALWAGETDLPAFLHLAGEALSAGRAAAVLRPHLADLRDLLASGPRQAVFDAWLAGLDPPQPIPVFADLKARLADDEEAAVAGLCALTDPACLSDQLALLDRWPVLAAEGLLANPAVRAAAWEHLKLHWDRLGEPVQGLGGRGLVAGLAAFADPAIAGAILQFFQDRPPPPGLRGALDRIASRAAFRDWARTAMDAFLLRQGAEGPAGDSQPVLAALNAGFQGALAQRAMLEGLGLTPPPWMHTLQNLRGALAAAERPWLQSLRGPAPVPTDLAHRLVEDLEAAAAQLAALTAKLPDTKDRDAALIVAAGLARAAITAERRTELAVLAAALTEDEAAARPLRAVLADRRAASAIAQAWIADPPRIPTRFQRLDLQNDAALAAGQLRLLAQDLRLALEGAAPDAWSAFGFDARTTELWRAAGFADAEAAAAWRLRGFAPKAARDLAAQGADPAALRRRPLANPAPALPVTLPDGTVLKVEQAADPAIRAGGLMNRDSLPPRGGMLFVFPDDRPRPITMAGVRFALDALWLGPDGTIRHIEAAAPAWRPQALPADPERARCRYLLELAAGAVGRLGLKVGDRLAFAV